MPLYKNTSKQFLTFSLYKNNSVQFLTFSASFLKETNYGIQKMSKTSMKWKHIFCVCINQSSTL